MSAKYKIITSEGKVRETNDKEEFSMLMDLLEEREKQYESEVND